MTPLVRVVCSPFVQLFGAIALVAALALLHVQAARSQPIIVVMPPAPIIAAQPTTVVAPVAYPYYCYGWQLPARVGTWPYCR